MDQLQVEFGQEKTPMSLSTVQFLGGLEVCEVLMIRKDHGQELRTLQVVVPSFESTDYSQKFMVINLVISLHLVKTM